MIEILDWTTSILLLIMHYLISIKWKYSFHFILLVTVAFVIFGYFLNTPVLAITNGIIFIIYLYRILKPKPTPIKSKGDIIIERFEFWNSEYIKHNRNDYDKYKKLFIEDTLNIIHGRFDKNKYKKYNESTLACKIPKKPKLKNLFIEG